MPTAWEAEFLQLARAIQTDSDGRSRAAGIGLAKVGLWAGRLRTDGHEADRPSERTNERRRGFIFVLWPPAASCSCCWPSCLIYVYDAP